MTNQDPYQQHDPYQQGQYPTNPFPEPAARSAWSSPIVLVSVAAGVLLVIAGILAAVILIPKSESTPVASSSVSTTVQPNGSTVTTTVTAAPPPAVSSTPYTPPPIHPNPTISGVDWQGFTDGPRCNAANDAAVVIGRTARSRVVICRVGRDGGLYYKGLANGNGIEVQFPRQSGNTFSAVNNGTTYVVGPGGLSIIGADGTRYPTEPMIEYWAQ